MNVEEVPNYLTSLAKELRTQANTLDQAASIVRKDLIE